MKPPLITKLLNAQEIFTPFGDYLEQRDLYLYFVNRGTEYFTYNPKIVSYNQKLMQLRRYFNMAKKQDSDQFGGFTFINFSPTREQIDEMNDMKMSYDDYATWLFDLIENQYTWKWSADEKNHCLRGALSCEDEGSPNYKKMVFFRHQDPFKVMLMSYYYDKTSGGVWEDIDSTRFTW